MKKRKWITKAAAFFLAVLTSVQAAAPAFAADAPAVIYINSAEDLLLLAKKCSLDTWSQDKTVVLNADLSLAGAGFAPIPTFGGIFDGGGHSITGLALSASVSPAGLFGFLQPGAVVRELNVSGDVRPSGAQDTVGGIAGVNNGTIEHCSFTGVISGVFL